MNFFIITTDEPFYLPQMLQDILASDDAKRIKGVILLSPVRKRQTWFSLIKEFWDLFDTKTFLITGSLLT